MLEIRVLSSLDPSLPTAIEFRCAGAFHHADQEPLPVREKGWPEESTTRFFEQRFRGEVFHLHEAQGGIAAEQQLTVRIQRAAGGSTGDLRAEQDRRAAVQR